MTGQHGATLLNIQANMTWLKLTTVLRSVYQPSNITLGEMVSGQRWESNRTRTHIFQQTNTNCLTDRTWTELPDWSNWTEHEHNAQWTSCKNAARNAWETNVFHVQYVTYTCDVLSINFESAYDVPVLWLFKGNCFLELFTNENAIVIKIKNLTTDCTEPN